jgi:hypothetical protein
MPAHPSYRGKRRFVHPKLANLTTAKVELEEIQRTLSDLQNDVAAGTLPARLIKIAAHKPWKTKESKPDIQLARERQQHEWDAAQGLAPPNGEISLEMDTHTHPTRSIKLLRMIVEASFRAGDLPNPEKHGIITGLPKADKKTVYAHVSSTTSLRPITVSPIIGRIINNVMAKRFGSALELNNILDPAQFAFLPGRNIHQAISAIVECFTQSNSTPNNTPGRECYALFYDISNAYPTVKWSSIQQALIEIGAPNPFIDFVVNSLQGTTISMKTNIPGRVTPAVEIHKSIKQGCPLAPILFTVVMDELHRQCSAIGGYSLHTPHRPSDSSPAETSPSTQVASRGYCDDTAILADTWSKLGKLHHCVSNFFTKHGFKLNLTKTYLVGRHADGSALSTPLYWPGATAPIIPH